MSLYEKSDPTNVILNFQEIEKRLRKLEKAPDPAADSAKTSDLVQLRKEMRMGDRDTPFSYKVNEVFRAGGAHAVGLVPDPGPTTTNSGKVLGENGVWSLILDGLVAAIPASLTSPDQRVVEILASLMVLNAIQADSLTVRRLTVYGTPRCRLTKAADFSHTVSATFIKIPFDTISENIGEMPDTANNRIVIKETGLYRITVNGGGAAYTAANGKQFSTPAYLNGTAFARPCKPMNVSPNPYGWAVTSVQYQRFVVNDYIEVYAYQETGGTYVFNAVLNSLDVELVGS